MSTSPSQPRASSSAGTPTAPKASTPKRPSSAEQQTVQPSPVAGPSCSGDSQPLLPGPGGPDTITVTAVCEVAMYPQMNGQTKELQVPKDITVREYLKRVAEACGEDPSKARFLRARDTEGFHLNLRRSLIGNYVANGARIHVGCSSAEASDDKTIEHFYLGIACLLVVGVLFSIWLYLKNHSGGNKLSSVGSYGIVIDAGSVHTNVNVYAWTKEKVGRTGFPNETFACENDAAQGISSFAAHPAGVADYLLTDSDCMTRAVASIPASVRPETVVFLGGTAGMRILNASRPDQASRIMERAQKALSSAVESTSVAKAKILSGTEEGIYGWITSNYLKGMFNKSTEQNMSTKPYGALDWGGASSQITFHTENATLTTHATKENSTYLPVHLYGKSYSVFTASHLCYGQAEALRRYFVQLVYAAYKNAGDELKTELDAPCQPRGGKNYDIVTAQDIFHSPCTRYRDAKFQSEMQSLDPELPFHFRGTSDHDKCLAEVRRSFDPVDCHSRYAKPFCFDSSRMPRPGPNVHFLAFSTYWYLTSALGASPRTSQPTFNRTVTKLCQAPARYAKKLLGSLGAEVQEHSCFKGVYMSVLLAEGYHIRDWERGIKFVDRVGNAEVGWTLGWMIERTKELPNLVLVRSERTVVDITVFVILALLLGPVILLAGLHLWESCCGSRAAYDNAVKRYKLGV